MSDMTADGFAVPAAPGRHRTLRLALRCVAAVLVLAAAAAGDMRRCSSRASSSGSSVSTARNASSHPITSVTASLSRSTAITCADAASYAGLSTGRNTASGHARRARAMGIAERIPNSRAS